MKLLADWLPILVFFAVYKTVDLLTATAAAIGASLAMVALLRLRGMPIDKMQWIGLGLIVVMGGATLLLNDETFIKHKPTALYAALGLGLVVPLLWGARPPLQSLMGKQMPLPAHVWPRLNAAWAGFFVVMGGLNAWVAETFSTDAWVDFKLFGTLGLTLLFMLAQIGLLASQGYLKEAPAPASPLPQPTDVEPAPAQPHHTLAEPMLHEAIEARLKQALAPESVWVRDDSEAHRGHAGAAQGGGHFEVAVVAACFDGKGRLARHRLVYDALADWIPHRIHALSIDARTPAEAGQQFPS